MKLLILLLLFPIAQCAPVIPPNFNLFEENVDVKVADGNIVLTNKETGSVRTVDQTGVVSGDDYVNVEDTQDDYDAVPGNQEDLAVEDTQDDYPDANDSQEDSNPDNEPKSKNDVNLDDTQDDSEEVKNEKDLDADLTQEDSEDDDEDGTEFQSSGGKKGKPVTRWRPSTTKRKGISRTTTRRTPPTPKKGRPTTPRTTTTKRSKPPTTTHPGRSTPNMGGTTTTKRPKPIADKPKPIKPKKISCTYAFKEVKANGVDNVPAEISAKLDRCGSVKRGFIKQWIMVKRKAGEEGQALLDEMISKLGEKAREMITEYVLNTPAETPDPQYDPEAPDAEDREDPEDPDDPEEAQDPEPEEPEDAPEAPEEESDGNATDDTEE